MLTRNPLLLAMAAAGLLAGEGLPDAYSEDVFVPELAVLDGALCQGLTREARAVERHLERAWLGPRERLDLARL